MHKTEVVSLSQTPRSRIIPLLCWLTSILNKSSSFIYVHLEIESFFIRFAVLNVKVGDHSQQPFFIPVSQRHSSISFLLFES